MGRGKLFMKKKKVIARLLVVAFMIGEILRPVSFLKAEELTGIKITVVTVEGNERTASGSDLETALKNLSGIKVSQIKKLVITGGQIREDDWTYMFEHSGNDGSEDSGQFSSLTDFSAEGNGKGEGDIPWAPYANNGRSFPASVERMEIPNGITSIGGNAFRYCKKMREITIPSSVKTIYGGAFGDCTYLLKVNLSKGLETIGEYAFCWCRELEQIKIPDSVTEIEDHAFEGCIALKEVILPRNLITIRYQTFCNCKSLQSITFPDYMTTIEAGAFTNCSELKEVMFPKSLQNIGEVLTGKGYGIFENCTSLTKVEIPGNVKVIGGYAFSGCSSLEEIVIGEGVETIGRVAFEGTAVKNIEIPGSLKTISAYAFNKCDKLEEITISEGVENIGIYAFANCKSLTELTVPTSVKLLSPCAFDNCSKLSVLKLFLKSEKEVAVINTHVTTEDISYSPFENVPTPRKMYYYTEEGLPLSNSTVPAFSDAVSAYRAEEDGDTSDNLWWGWQMEEAYSVVSHLTNLTGSNKAAVWRETDKDYTTTLTPKVSAGGVDYVLPQSVVVKIGDRTASPETDYIYDPVSGTLLIKASSIDGNIEIEAAANVVLNTGPTLDPTTSPTPDQTASPTPTVNPEQTPEPTPTPTPAPDKDVSDIADGLGVSGETAQKIQEAAKELDVSKDTILVTDKTITSQKTDDDIKGAYFARIQARASQITENNIKLVWNKVKGADGYLIYDNRCNTKKWIYEYKLVKTITNISKCSYIERKCKKGNYYKFIVRAYKNIDGKKVTIAVSKTIHVVTNGGKNGNAGSVRVNKGKVSLKKGKTFQIKAKEIKQKKKLQYHRKVCYESSNPKVASVSKKGVIKAKKKGKCNVFVYAQSGIYKKVTVTVK